MGLEKNERFSIQKERKTERFDMPKLHEHDYYEVYYLLSGDRRYFINHSIYNIKSGTIVLIPKGDLHMTSTLSTAYHERILLTFNDVFLQPICNFIEKEKILKCFNSNKIIIPLSQTDYFESLLNKILKEYKSSDPFSRLLAGSYIVELLILLNRYSKSDYVPANIQKSEKKIQDICEYVYENFQKDITLSQISEMNNISTTYLSKKFKKVTGSGFNEYLNKVRVKQATELLINTKKLVSEISSECGFKDSNYFGDVFKKIKGISPTKFRKSHKIISGPR